MGRVILIGMSTVMAFVVTLACGGSTTGTSTIGSGGSPGTGGSGGGRNGSGGSVSSGGQGAGGRLGCTNDTDCIYPLLCFPCPDGSRKCPTGASCVAGQCVTRYDHECGLSTGGSTGSGGSSGNTGGTGGSVSPGTVPIEFTLTGPGAYCLTCNSIDIKDANGRSLTLECAGIDCASCSTSGCPNSAVCPKFAIAVTGAMAVTGAKMNWDGTTYVPWTCGTGTSCTAMTYAKPGKYTATFCATPSQFTGPDGGIGQCVPSGPAKCGSVDFDFPSSTVVKGTVGP